MKTTWLSWRSFFAVLLMVGLGVSASHATTLRVPEDHSTIRAALVAAQEGDSVLVQPGYYPETGLTLLAGRWLVGLGEPGSARIVGDGAHRLLTTGGTDLVPVIQGMGFTGGSAESGGAVRVNTGTAILDHCLFVDNEASVAGGALELDGSGSSQVRHCTFVGNSAPQGAALRVESGQSPAIENCLITLNTGGAAVLLASASRLPMLSDCDIVENPGGDWTGFIAGFLGSLGNIQLAPGFCDEDEDWHVAAASPCLPGNNPDGESIGALGLGCAEAGLHADFQREPAAGAAPLAVTFHALVTGDPERIEWDFEGDGVWEEGPADLVHVYPVMGEHRPKMRAVRGDDVATSIHQRPVTVQYGVSFTVADSVGREPFEAEFHAQPVGSPNEYEWDFGDGQTLVSAEPVVRHTFEHFGTYRVAVVARDGSNEATCVAPSCVRVTSGLLHVPLDGELHQVLHWAGEGTRIELSAGDHLLPDVGQNQTWEPLRLPAGVQLVSVSGEGAATIRPRHTTAGPLFLASGSGPPLVLDGVSFWISWEQTAVALSGDSRLEANRCHFFSGPTYSACAVLADDESHARFHSCELVEATVLALGNSAVEADSCRVECFHLGFSCHEEACLDIRSSRLKSNIAGHGRRLTLLDCEISGTAYNQIGALSSTGDTLLARNVVIQDRSQASPLVWVEDGRFVRFEQCAFVRNTRVTLDTYSLFSMGAGVPWSMRGCLVWGNSNWRTVDPTGSVPDSVTCCDIGPSIDTGWVHGLESFAGVDGNMAQDPQFCDNASDSLLVMPDSPCLPENNGCGIAIGNLSQTCENSPVVAGFLADNHLGIAPMPVVFTDQSTGDVRRRQWDFESDGVWDSEERNPTHIFTGDGLFSVTLRVSSDLHADTLVQQDLIFCHLPRLLRVPADFANVAQALLQAQEGDTVELACGTYFEHDLELPDGITLRSQSGYPDCAVIDAQGQGRVLVGDSLFTGVLVRGLTIRGGRALGQSLAGLGGGAYLVRTVARFENCVFRDNAAVTAGALWVDARENLVLDHCVLTGNSATNLASAVRCTGSRLHLQGCIVSGQLNGSLFTGTPLMECTDIHGNMAGDWMAGWAAQLGVAGNISADPLFCDAAGGDFRLQADSPCQPQEGGCDGMGAFPGDCSTSGVAPPARPAGFTLGLAVPNPFNPVTQLELVLPEASPVQARLFNLAGQQVAVLHDGFLPAGRHLLRVEGASMASGIYLLRLDCGAVHEVRKLTLLK